MVANTGIFLLVCLFFHFFKCPPLKKDIQKQKQKQPPPPQNKNPEQIKTKPVFLSILEIDTLPGSK